jgi:hypothetical protein
VEDGTTSLSSSVQSSPNTSYFKKMAITSRQSLQKNQMPVYEEAIQTHDLVVKQSDMLGKLIGEGSSYIDWTSFAPQQHYHPDNFINSLDDTPHLYRPPATDVVAIPVGICPFVDPPKERGFGWSDLDDAVRENPASVFVSDIVASHLGSMADSDMSVINSSTPVSVIRHTFYEQPRLSLEKRCGIVIGREKLVTALFDSVGNTHLRETFISIA